MQTKIHSHVLNKTTDFCKMVAVPVPYGTAVMKNSICSFKAKILSTRSIAYIGMRNMREQKLNSAGAWQSDLKG